MRSPRPRLASLIELFVLCGIAFAQPMFDLLQKNPSVLVTGSVTSLDLVLFAVGVLVAPAVALWIVELVVGRWSTAAGEWAHRLIVGALCGLIALEFLTRGDFATVIVVAVIVVAVVLAIRLAQSSGMRLWLRYLIVAPVAFAVIFVGFSPASDAVRGGGLDDPRAEIGKPVRVVFILFDELPTESLLDGNGAVDAELYPNFADLANTATWYRNHTSVAPFTDGAVPAILTGEYPPAETPLPVLAEYPDNLFTALGGTYSFNAYESLTRLCPEVLCTRPSGSDATGRLMTLTGEAFDLWRDFAFASGDDEDDAFAIGGIDYDPLRTAQRFANKIEPTDEPRLDFLHVLLPHQPWHYLPAGHDIGGDTTAPGQRNEVWLSEWSAREARERHLLQLQATDEFVGRVTARLRAIDAFDDALIVVTGDHGVAFSAGEPMRGISAANTDQVVWAPLFVKYPDQRAGVVDDRPAEAVDVVPTIADVLDARLDWEPDGRSLLGPSRSRDVRRVAAWDRSTLEPVPPADHLEIDGADGFAEVMRARATSTPAGARWRIAANGPNGALVGTRASDLTIATRVTHSGRLADPARFAAVDTARRLVPWVDVRGSVEDAGDDLALAVAVNGTIAGVGGTYDDGDQRSFSVLVAPDAFRDGANEVVVYAVSSTGGATQLSPIASTATG